MKTFEVVVEKDHIESLAKAKPIRALSELVWNAYDADASEVRIELEGGGITKLDIIRVIDNGTGIPFDDAARLFKSIGGSWKRMKRRTNQGRSIHGTKGQGRMKAFALGMTVDWISDCEGQRFTITGSVDNLKHFRISEPTTTTRRGCTVEISNVAKDFQIRAEHGFVDAIRDIFALQLHQDTSFQLIYDGVNIDASDAIHHVNADCQCRSLRGEDGHTWALGPRFPRRFTSSDRGSPCSPLRPAPNSAPPPAKGAHPLK